MQNVRLYSELLMILNGEKTKQPQFYAGKKKKKQLWFTLHGKDIEKALYVYAMSMTCFYR